MFKRLTFTEIFTISVALLASLTILILPLVLFLVDGTVRGSLSQYVLNTHTYWIFKSTLILISISLMFRVKYIIPAVLILGIVFFDVNDSKMIHNLISILFFTYITIIMCIDEPQVLGYLMLLNGLTLIGLGLFWFEVVAISLIITHQLLHINKFLKLKNSNNLK